MNDVMRKLRLLKEEDFIWLIYFFIITYALISNKFEKDFLINKNRASLNTAQHINTTVLIIAFFIYLYFVIVTIENFDLLKQKGSTKEVRVAMETLIANILFLVAGAISLYANYDSSTTRTDIAIF